MKCIKIFAATALLLLAGRLQAQISPFTAGKIVYHATYPDTSESSTVSGFAFPEEISILLADGICESFLNSLYVSNTLFTNLKTRKTSSYLQVAARKVDIESDLDTMLNQAFARAPFQLEQVSGSKTILGISCQKLIAHYENKAIPDAIIFYTRDIPFLPIPLTMAFGKVPGFIMELEENYQGLAVHLKVSALDKTIPDNNAMQRPVGFAQVPASQVFNLLAKPF